MTLSIARAHVLVLLAALFGCGERVEAGFANAPSMERKSEPRNQYDTVSNGEEGCESRNGASVASAAGACPKATTTIGDGGKSP